MAVFDNEFLVHSHCPRHDAQQLPCEPTLCVRGFSALQYRLSAPENLDDRILHEPS
ncbi:hypothetical protein ASPTUDRAFT_48885 [Aspergillus tubingensis CBS 134.48]|uniref:Uncharacterized protein n=1 Tax=Aspergillus tubingensis (strain CBS 134.48) TaxID=767770 RepID=A0A1L9NJ90_ASPTC|nr:hypothetical protein ASPTUDRAFT_48885 [Aspergillus tubingensis CBS 134.48]